MTDQKMKKQPVRVWGSYLLDPRLDDPLPAPLPKHGTMHLMHEGQTSEIGRGGGIAGDGSLRIAKLGLHLATTSLELMALVARNATLGLNVASKTATSDISASQLSTDLAEDLEGTTDEGTKPPGRAIVFARAIPLIRTITIPPRQNFDMILRCGAPLIDALKANEETGEHFIEIRGYLVGVARKSPYLTGGE